MDNKKRLPGLIFISAIVAVLPAFVDGANQAEREAWKQATRRNDLAAYDDFLSDHPDGIYKNTALSRAGKLGAQKLRLPGEYCDPMFPLAAYYAVAAGEKPLVSGPVLSHAVKKARKCDFVNLLDEEGRRRAADGLIAVRDAMEGGLVGSVAERAFLDLDLVLYELEERVIRAEQEKVYLCSDQRAWVDTPLKEKMECSKPHIEVQTKMAEAMAEQAEFDFSHVHLIENDEYRLAFWKAFAKIAKTGSMQQIAGARNLISKAGQAKARETDPRIKKKIEEAAKSLQHGNIPAPPP